MRFDFKEVFRNHKIIICVFCLTMFQKEIFANRYDFNKKVMLKSLQNIAIDSIRPIVIPLYENQIPNSIQTLNQEVSVIPNDIVLIKVSRPTLTIYFPEKRMANGSAVIICPGGGYSSVWIKKEGYDIAEKLVKRGVTAFVLKYRLPSDSTMKNKSIGPLQDAQQAIKIVRENALKWGLDPNKVGIMGFSAGGHLASTLGTHFNTSLIDNKKETSLRPNFMILVYPVISFNSAFGHMATRNNLLGAFPSDSLVKMYSNELQVTKETPPTFLVHASDDDKVPVTNSIRFYEALTLNLVPSELHIYFKGGHGFLTYPPLNYWMESCFQWMSSNQWIR